LDHRIAAAIHPWRWKRTAVAAAAAISVAFGTFAILHRRTPTPKQHPIATATTTPATNPVSISRTYGGVIREGIVGATPDGRPLERYRRQTVRQTLVFDPKTGKTVTISIPREEVYVVAVKTF
jgi:hypothetical protein